MNQDAYEAIWEHHSGRKLEYPRPRVTEPVHFRAANVAWQAVPGQPGVSTKALGSFTERDIRIGCLRVEAGASYQMPALFQHGAVVYYGAFKQHLGLYPPVVDEPALRERVARYAGPKGNLQFRYAEPLPLVLIADVVRARLAVNLAKAKPR